VALVPLELAISDRASRRDAVLHADMRGTVRTLWRWPWWALWSHPLAMRIQEGHRARWNGDGPKGAVWVSRQGRPLSRRQLNRRSHFSEHPSFSAAPVHRPCRFGPHIFCRCERRLAPGYLRPSGDGRRGSESDPCVVARTSENVAYP
jgi:hypothetical protein